MRLYFLLKRGHRWLILWTLSWISCEASWTLNNSKCFLYYPKVWDGEPWGPPFCYLQLSHLADTLSMLILPCFSQIRPKTSQMSPESVSKASRRPPRGLMSPGDVPNNPVLHPQICHHPLFISRLNAFTSTKEVFCFPLQHFCYPYFDTLSSDL